MNSLGLVEYVSIPVTLAIAILTNALALRADTILPSSNFTCIPSSSCVGGATQLPASDGIQGVEFSGLVGESFGSNVAEFVFQTSGLLGSGIPSGTSIPYSFTFSADSTNIAGTMIDSASFLPDSNFILLNDEHSTIVVNGKCGVTNTHWCFTAQGTGTISFPLGVASGQLLDLSADFTIDTVNNLGTPGIDLLQGQVDFNPVPEPRGSLVILLAAGVAFASRRVRNRVRAR